MATQTAINLEDFLPAAFTAPELTDEQFLAVFELFPGRRCWSTPRRAKSSSCRRTDPINGAVGALRRPSADSGRRTPGEARSVARMPAFCSRARARRSPDASWFEGYPATGPRFAVFAPQFVIEVRSPDDRLARLRDKMQRYIAAGVLLAWLIDPFERTVTIYRPDREPEVLAIRHRWRAKARSRASCSISAASLPKSGCPGPNRPGRA